ncbi:MAG: hypothetical protein ACXADY_03435 [Candidatus Hodarchaeales archaeon]
MVNFCENCGNLLIPRQKRRIKQGYVNLYCNFCKKGIDKEFRETSYLVITRIPHDEKDRTQVIDEVFSIYPKIRNLCPRCGYYEAQYWEAGNRRKVEWESMTYYKCLKCSWLWFES